MTVEHNILLWLDEKSKPIEDYNCAIALNPNDLEYYLVRGVIYFGKGQYDRAIDDYNRAALLNPKNMAIYYNRGKAHEKKGQNDKAFEGFKMVNIIK